MGNKTGEKQKENNIFHLGCALRFLCGQVILSLEHILLWNL